MKRPDGLVITRSERRDALRTAVTPSVGDVEIEALLRALDPRAGWFEAEDSPLRSDMSELRGILERAAAGTVSEHDTIALKRLVTRASRLARTAGPGGPQHAFNAAVKISA